MTKTDSDAIHKDKDDIQNLLCTLQNEKKKKKKDKKNPKKKEKKKKS